MQVRLTIIAMHTNQPSARTCGSAEQCGHGPRKPIPPSRDYSDLRVVMLAGIAGAALGMAMLRRVQSRTLRSLFITAGALLAGILLLLMTDINLLILLGYPPYGIVKVITGAEFGRVYLEMLGQWTVVHQLLCPIGVFLWLGATVSYARRSGDTCRYCGRRDGQEGWDSPGSGARGPDRRVCRHGSANHLRRNPLRLGTGKFTGDERRSICASGRSAEHGYRAFS